MKDNKTKVFVLTKDELIKMRGTHGFGSWKIACTGCRKEFTDTDIGGTIVSVSRDAKRVLPKIPVRRTCVPDREERRCGKNKHDKPTWHPPKFYYHKNCFNLHKVRD